MIISDQIQKLSYKIYRSLIISALFIAIGSNSHCQTIVTNVFSVDSIKYLEKTSGQIDQNELRLERYYGPEDGLDTIKNGLQSYKKQIIYIEGQAFPASRKTTYYIKEYDNSVRAINYSWDYLNSFDAGKTGWKKSQKRNVLESQKIVLFKNHYDSLLNFLSEIEGKPTITQENTKRTKRNIMYKKRSVWLFAQRTILLELTFCLDCENEILGTYEVGLIIVH